MTETLDPEARSDLRKRADSERDKTRTREAAPLGDLLGELALPQLTDAEWEARDARAREIMARSPSGAVDRLAELEAGGFPRRALDAYRHGVAPADAISKLAEATGRTIGIVVISGPPGIGKTVAATWLAARRREPWQFVRASALLAASRYDRAARDRLYSTALVVDDIGAEYADPKGSFAADLDELLDVFYGSMRPLVITTNILSVAKGPDGKTVYPFVERYGERIADRLRECGRWISLTGESRRRGARAVPS